tara:strand:+ start:400 stop:717 length:318 start_codon:yes stop_codon:yes gene_type:complete
MENTKNTTEWQVELCGEGPRGNKSYKCKTVADKAEGLALADKWRRMAGGIIGVPNTVHLRHVEYQPNGAGHRIITHEKTTWRASFLRGWTIDEGYKPKANNCNWV